MTFSAPIRSATDDHLVAAVRAGDEQAFEGLYARYQPRITGYVQRMVRSPEQAEEIAQEAFISALRRLRGTDKRIAFKPWIYEIAKNAAIDHVRARNRRGQEVDFADAESAGASATRFVRAPVTPEDALADRQAIADLQGAFGGLADAHHKILVLRELEGLSYDQIGERMTMSRGQVESTLFRARRRLEEEYEELVTGERCRQVRDSIVRHAEAATAELGVREERRFERHISHCQSCRREARRSELASAVERVAA